MLTFAVALASSFALVSRSAPDTFVDAQGTHVAARAVHLYADVVVVELERALLFYDPRSKAIVGAHALPPPERARAALGFNGLFEVAFDGVRGDDGRFAIVDVRTPNVHSSAVTTFVDARGVASSTLPRRCLAFGDGRAACAWVRHDEQRAAWGTVPMDRKWGYVDTAGAVAIEPRFHEADTFEGGVARVQLTLPPRGATQLPGGLVSTFIDVDGKPKWAAHYDELAPFTEDLAFFVASDAKHRDGGARGYLGRDGKTAIALARTEKGGPFVDGVAAVFDWRKESARLIDRKGVVRLRVPPAFTLLRAVSPNGAHAPRGRLGDTHDTHGARGPLRLEDRTRWRMGADVSPEGHITDAPDLWGPPPPWPDVGARPTAAVVPMDEEYVSLRNAAFIVEDAAEACAAAAELVTRTRGADADAWLASERCALLANDEPGAARARAAFLVVAGLEAPVRAARAAWARMVPRTVPRMLPRMLPR